MKTQSVDVSVVCSTLGRGQELARLFDSLERQSLKSVEVIVVDQNHDERVAEVISGQNWSFPIVHVRTPSERGSSRGRNVGFLRSSGTYVVFADDDCWYPATYFQRAKELCETTKAHIVCGRAVDEAGRSINGRFETSPQDVNRNNAWTTSIEWMLFFRSEVFRAVQGFDEFVGVGASTPWQSAEGQDIVLRALSAGFICRFDPSLTGRHAELNIINPDTAMRRKARAYARGMGYVLRRHGYSLGSLIRWVGRPCLAAGWYGLTGRGSRALYYTEVARGRLEGWLHVNG